MRVVTFTGQSKKLVQLWVLASICVKQQSILWIIFVGQNDLNCSVNWTAMVFFPKQKHIFYIIRILDYQKVTHENP